MLALILLTITVLFFIVYIIYDYKSMVSELERQEKLFNSLCKQLDDMYKRYGGKR